MYSSMGQKTLRGIAYCLLPIAYCLLPIAYCLLPIATDGVSVFLYIFAPQSPLRTAPPPPPSPGSPCLQIEAERTSCTLWCNHHKH